MSRQFFVDGLVAEFTRIVASVMPPETAERLGEDPGANASDALHPDDLAAMRADIRRLVDSAAGPSPDGLTATRLRVAITTGDFRRWCSVMEAIERSKHVAMVARVREDRADDRRDLAEVRGMEDQLAALRSRGADPGAVRDMESDVARAKGDLAARALMYPYVDECVEASRARLSAIAAGNRRTFRRDD